MNCEELLNEISVSYGKALKDNLIGIYVHGSLAFGCFHWNTGDIDFLVVTRKPPALQEKIELIQTLLDLEKSVPQKGLEMSVVLEKYCRNFIYPTPFELHFSNAYIDRCKSDLEKYCAEMNGTDRDLAAHFTVVKAVGFTLCGKDLASVFKDVPKACYLDSIKHDVKDAQNEIHKNPVSVILNLCRVLAFAAGGFILSKKQGGLWAIENLPAPLTPIIEAAIESYGTDTNFSADDKLLTAFAEYMTERIFVKKYTV